MVAQAPQVLLPAADCLMRHTVLSLRRTKASRMPLVFSATKTWPTAPVPPWLSQPVQLPPGAQDLRHTVPSAATAKRLRRPAESTWAMGSPLKVLPPKEDQATQPALGAVW